MQIKTEFLVAALVLSSYHTKTSSVTPRAVSETDHDHGRSLRQTYSTAHEVGWMESKLATVTEKIIHLKEELSRTQKKIEPTQLKEGKEKLNQIYRRHVQTNSWRCMCAM
ncbi:unnamed protein product [Peronospora belbahrii]|uniref:RxLR effector protein n=1 Tax=Peronospora belbahrii TaxID=622444 RepID=A0ABN8CLY2_9STRA|nr:unnamed protein product [Peronospora belbahrii]